MSETDTETTPAPEETAPEGMTPEGGSVTIAFEAPFFKRVDDLYFRLDDASREAVAVVKLGEEHLALPLPGIRREFKLGTDTPDGKMLTLVAKALKYVKLLRPGDPLPTEVTSRKPSWTPSVRHQQIAYHRLAMQLLGWLSGDEHVITNPDELLQVAGDPTFKKKVNTAFGEAAEALGLGRENREQVTHYLTDLSHELSYIEAMRDQFHTMERTDQKIQALRRIYGNELTVLQTVDSVARLMERAEAEFKALFDLADAQTGEIMAALRNLESQKTYIQNMRDDLRVRLIAWEDILHAWEEQIPLPVKRSRRAEDLLAETYRFLAPRYMPVDKWVMMTKLQGAEMAVTADGKAATVKTGQKKLGGHMEWL